MIIKKVIIRKILNSQGLDAVEIELLSSNNISAISSSPSAIITGKREVTTNSISQNDSIKLLIDEIIDKSIESQKQFDDILEKYIGKLGSTICLPFSLSFSRVMAKEQNLSLVQYLSNVSQINEQRKSLIPLVTIFSGGVHNFKESIQNIMIAVDIHPFSEAVPVITNIYSYIENLLKDQNMLEAYGSSSGMITNKITIDEKFKIVLDTIKQLGYQGSVSIAIDVAAEHFFNNGIYV